MDFTKMAALFIVVITVLSSLHHVTESSTTSTVPSCGGCNHLTKGCQPSTYCLTYCCSTIAFTTTEPNNAPVILSLPASVDLSESLTASTFLQTLVTNDTDGDEVSCTISSTNPTNGPFFLKIADPTPTDFSLYTTAYPDLNYTLASVNEISVTCFDIYGASDTQIFYVYVIINGMPIFLNLQNSTTVDSTAGVGITVFEVLAYDTEGDNLNFGLSCSGTSTCPFSIYSSGLILLTSSLQGTTNYAYDLLITANDGYHATDPHRLTVYVTGLNTAPVITNLPATVQVSEDAAAGTSIFTLTVYDNDGDNSFTVSANSNPSSGASVFSISNTALQISIASGQTLDHETASQYVLNITASDGSLASTYELLTIDVADVNEAPELLKVSYNVIQDEGTAGTSFGAPTMEAVDPDTGDTLTYSLDSASASGCSYISVNSTTGAMSYSTNYDVDDTSLLQLFTCLIKVEDTGGLSVTATVTVSIQDVNDNSPAFSNSVFYFSVGQSDNVGTSVGVASATDGDRTSPYNTVDYSIDQSSLSQTYFSIDSSGTVTLAASVSTLTVGTTLTCTLYANNTGAATGDIATLHVTIVESGSGDGFWDSGANIAWVTLTILGLAGLGAAVGYAACKFWPKGDESNIIRKVKPSEPVNQQRRPTPRPKDIDNNSLKSAKQRAVTPSEVKIENHRWEAWSNTDGIWNGSSPASPVQNDWNSASPFDSNSNWRSWDINEAWGGDNVAPSDTRLASPGVNDALWDAWNRRDFGGV